MAKRQAAKRPAGRKSTAKKTRPRSKRKTQLSPARAAYAEAVAAYERGLKALQRHDYARARDTLEGILTSYPAERELLDRVRLYLQVCERRTQAPEAAPQTVEERLYAATVALNAGDQQEALQLLSGVQAEEPDNDHALYMMGVTQLVNGDSVAGLDYLQQAIALNPDNRALARQDPELEALQSTDAFKHMLETTVSPPRRSRGRRKR